MGKLGRKKYRVVVISVTAFVVLASAGISYWIYRSYQEAVGKAEEYRQQIAVARVKNEKVPVLEKDVIKLRENVKEYVKILPDTNEVNGFVKKLADFAEQSGVALSVLKDENRANRRRKVKEVFGHETFRVDLRGNVFQLLKFLSQVENYERFIKIVEIQIKAGTREKDMLPGDVVHEISLTMETFVYHGNEGGAGATKIQNYEKKREMLADEIASARNQIEVEHYVYAYDPTVRDPFLDPRPFVSEAMKPEGLATEEQEKFITQVQDKLLEVEQLLEYAKGAKDIPSIRKFEILSEAKNRLDEVLQKIELARKEQWVTEPGYSGVFTEKIVPKAKQAQKEYEVLVAGTSEIPREDLEQLREKLEGLFTKGAYQDCLDYYRSVKEGTLKDQWDHLRKDPKNRKILEEMDLVAGKSEIALEFQDIKIEITGIIDSKDGPSVAIVNKKVLKEGQYLQDDLMVEKIGEKEVLFRYKGVTFPVHL